jgi:hypothetical protein
MEQIINFLNPLNYPMIESFFAFLHEYPAARWIIVSCALCLTAMAIWWPKNWSLQLPFALPFQKKPCGRCGPQKGRAKKTEPSEPAPELLPTSFELKPIAPANPHIYRKSILFNKKNVEFDITFPKPEDWKREALKDSQESFLEDPLHPPTLEADQPWENYTLQIRCIHPLSGPEREALHQYLCHEGYIEDAQNFYKTSK